LQWLYSTNAKEIGTLYLIFSIFAGMIGTAFSVLVRPCVIIVEMRESHLHLIVMLATSGLGHGENPRLNLAYLLEAFEMLIQIYTKMQVAISMVKVILLESNPLITSRKGLVHV
jgi:hypothetical protein